MAANGTARPFDEGANSVKVRTDFPNPYDEGTVEFRNFELGRSFALRQTKSAQLHPVQRPA